MNNELANFFVSFNTQGLAELKQGMDDLSKKMDAVEKDLKKGTDGFDGFFKSIGKLLPKLSLLTTALAGVKEALNMKNEIISMQNLATSVGVGADKIEGMGRALHQFGGNWQTAGGLYGRITDMMTKLYWGDLNESDLISKYGVDIVGALTAGDYEGVIAGISNAMSNQKFAGFQREIAAGFLGGDQALDLFFRQGYGNVAEQIARAEAKNFKSTPEAQRESRELHQATFNLKEAWQKASQEFMPALTSLLQAIDPLITALQPLFAGLSAIITALSPIITWLGEKLGWVIGGLGTGLEDTATLLSSAFDWATGAKSKEEFLQDIHGTATAGAVGKAVDSLNNYFMTRDAANAYNRILAGDYGWAEVHAMNNWLDSAEKELNFEQVSRINDVIKNAASQLSMTNNPLNTSTGSVDNSDNRSVYIDTINIQDSTGTMAGKANAIGQTIKNGVSQTAFQPVYNTRVGV